MPWLIIILKQPELIKLVWINYYLKLNLWICSHIRCWNIGVDSNKIMYLLGKNSGKSFKLRDAQVPWIATYPSFSPTIGYVGYCCLPRH